LVRPGITKCKPWLEFLKLSSKTFELMQPHRNEWASNSALRFRYQCIWQGIVSLAAVGLTATFAFAATFTTFQPFDDEGYFLQAYRQYLSGRVLYDQVFAFYGPFSFYCAALFARFDAVNVTHDNFRWALLPVWIVIGLLFAGVVWRWTGRYSPALVAFLLLGFCLRSLSDSVGHPQLWTILAVAVLLWLGLDWIYLLSKQRYAFWTGFVIGVIFLCKINVGILVFIAILLATSFQLRGRLRTLACGMLIVAAGGLGLLVLFTRSLVSEKYFALAYLGSLALIVGIAFVRPVEQEPSLKSLKWLVAGLGICLCAGIGVTLALGTTFRALFRSYVTEPALLARNYHLPYPDPTYKKSILLSLIGLAFAIGTFGWRRLRKGRHGWLGLLKIAAGTGLLCAFFHSDRQALTGSLLFLWLLLVDHRPMSQTEYSHRLLLALLGLLLSLQLFPIAGAQVDFAALVPITAAAVLLADGTNCIDNETFRMQFPRLTWISAGGTGTLLATLLFLFVGGIAILRYQQWRAAQPVNLPGTRWLRLPPMEADRLTVPVSELRRDCRVVLLVPGLYSYSLWSGVPPIEQKQINSWPFLWPDEVRKNELSRLRQQNRGCVLVSRDAYGSYRRLAVSPGNDEILFEIQRTMRPIFAFQDFTLFDSSREPGNTSDPPEGPADK
jgi:hypothetical protein